MANDPSPALLRGYGEANHYIALYLARFIRQHAATAMLDPLSVVHEVSSSDFYIELLYAYSHEVGSPSEETEEFKRGVKAAIANFVSAASAEAPSDC